MLKMATQRRGGDWREDHRKVQKTLSIPLDIRNMLDAHNNASEAITRILETHRESVGDGDYDQLALYERGRVALLIEEELPRVLPQAIEHIIRAVADKMMLEPVKPKSKL